MYYSAIFLRNHCVFEKTEGMAKIHFTKSAFTEDKKFSLSSVNDVAGAIQLQTNKKCYKLYCYNDVHAIMNRKAENSWLSDLQELSGFICSRGACSEFLL